MVYDQNQDASNLISGELWFPKRMKLKYAHSTGAAQYSVQCAPWNLNEQSARVRRSFWWKGMLGDIRQFVESCPVCQMEKSDHTLTKGKLMSAQIPET